MNLGISARLALGFGVLIAMMLVMAGVSYYTVATLDQRIILVASEHFKDTMNAVRIRETVNEVTRALYNLTADADEDTRRKEAERLKLAEKEIAGNFETLKSELDDAEELPLLKQAQDAYASYAAARAKIIALALANQNGEIAAAIQQDLRPAQRRLFNALADIVDLKTRRVEESAKAAGALAAAASVVLLVLGVVALAGGILSSWWIARSIARPTRAALRVTQAIAEGDLTHPIAVTSRDELGRLLEALEKMRLSLTGEVRVIRRSADNVATSATEITHSSSDLSTRAEREAAHLEESAASTAELTNTVKQNADSAATARELAARAAEVASRGGAAVRGVVGTMEGISASSARITDIISVIDTIAFQTNILALNAAVEAARAGEQGRGFAVVAAEVRALAQRSAQAAKEISGLIQTSTAQVRDGTVLVADAGATMEEIVSAVNRVSEINSAIALASREQLTGIEQVNEAVSQMSGATQQNAAAAAQAAASAEGLSDQARELSAAVARFRLDASEAEAPQAMNNFRNTGGTAQTPVGAKQAATLAATAAAARIKRAVAPVLPAAKKPSPPTAGDGEWKEF